MILGNNANEGAGFVDFTPDGPGEEALAAATQRVACGISQAVKYASCLLADEGEADRPSTRNRLLAGHPTYRYEYAGNFSNISPLPWFGAYHSCKEDDQHR